MMDERRPQPRLHKDDPQTGRVIVAQVKWFNIAKGFGFVTPIDGTPDAFLPMAILRRAGVEDIREGSVIECSVGVGGKGPLVLAITRIDPPSPLGIAPVPPPPPRAMAPARPSSTHPVRVHSVSVRPVSAHPVPAGSVVGPVDLVGTTRDGVVKWFEANKGFGFVGLDEGDRDVFVHITALRRCGLDRLDPGQRVRVAIIEGRKGLEAEYIDMI